MNSKNNIYKKENVLIYRYLKIKQYNYDIINSEDEAQLQVIS